MKIQKLTFYIVLTLSLRLFGAIYGNDGRQEIPPKGVYAKMATGVATSFSETLARKKPSGSYFLEFLETNLHEEYGICKDEKYSSQPSSQPSCTGFLISEDILMTAGHCMVNHGETINMSTPYCEDFHWLFDYTSKYLPHITDSTVTGKNVVKCSKIIYAVNTQKYNPSTKHVTHFEDFAIIKLERKLSERYIFQLSSSTKAIESSIEMIGHPLGLPAKLHTQSKILELGHFYRTNLDAFEGNSGSPVFDQNKKVIGLLSFGAPDFTTGPSCDSLNLCDNDALQCTTPSPHYSQPGEWVMPSHRILQKLKELGISPSS